MTRATIHGKKTAGMDLANASFSTVSQVWCVSQDRNASKEFVGDILQLNQIAVQREETPSSKTSGVEAFYVAATPTQMKLAMSQISNNADVEMIKMPHPEASPIADAAAKQFTQSNTAAQPESSTSPRDQNLPPRFLPSQAMAQQLVSNPLPRSLPEPVPPILKSGTPIEGLQNAARSTAGMSMGPSATPRTPKRNTAAGMGGMGGPGGATGAAEIASAIAQPKAKRNDANADTAMAEVETILEADRPPKLEATQQAVQPSRKQAELDKYLNDSDQLQQYLILVRGGDKEDD